MNHNTTTNTLGAAQVSEPGPSTLAKVALWESRIVLTFATLLFAFVASRSILDPVSYAGSSSIVLATGQAMTHIRAAEGGFPLGLSLICLFCLLSSKRHVWGLTVLGTIVAVILIVRTLGAFVDHSLATQVRLIVPETVVAVLCAVGIWLNRQATLRLSTPR